jgi:fructokinase
VLLDPNGRPHAVKDSARYRATVDAFLERVDIAKVSVGDLELLYPLADAQDGARSMLALGPAAVLVTDGSGPVTVHTARSEHSVAVPAVEVVDTIGAGDAFVAGFLTWWSNNSMTRRDAVNAQALVEATAAAIRVATAACTVRGANLPAAFDWSATEPDAPIRLMRDLR